ncbi:MAG: hypothetical protein KDA60_09675 [Planctomycetales bacterium]|nr:hypothetical protein [Planctomycetales bacterium]
MERRVGIIGIGLVGTAIAERLLRSSVIVVGYDVQDETRESPHQAETDRPGVGL